VQMCSVIKSVCTCRPWQSNSNRKRQAKGLSAGSKLWVISGNTTPLPAGLLIAAGWAIRLPIYNHKPDSELAREESQNNRGTFLVPVPFQLTFDRA